MKRHFVILVLVLGLGLTACLKEGEVKDTPKAVPPAKWHKMTIGQRMNIDKTALVYRVPGGWVFNASGSYGESACFIPYSDEGEDEENAPRGR